ncbi:TetR/AcrR family transcriptional regulator [Streptomyces sp. NPDC002812]|uniref:TetR/AcrR family transcriptional regulator n=1 Tax=unclassified Streptomyces TaxID=2593676 RepID=UPI0022550682|nr:MULTISPECIES: TetR/AcrR family transcriptional regulator [unclassified Streptomyces]MCX5127581.1 TetR/AcrR family transcriptional regulator [Streptomyces sp. NBC_00347]MCX5295000.1 TetR/AcrR family transcriptional regulator [Streptomyces sp. NBC_00193]
MPEAHKLSRAQSDRAKWTYGKILDAAGLVFERNGYEGASVNEIIRVAAVTKGAFYFHFRSKKDLAVAILESTLQVDGLIPQEIKLQEVVDAGLILSHRISRDPKIMAALRLSLTHEARDVYGTPWPEWIKFNTAQLNEAQRRGEIGCDVKTADQAHQISGTWSGLVLTGHSIYGNLDGLEERIATMYENLMIVIAHPRIFKQIDYSPTRGRDLYQAFLDQRP